MSFNWEEGRQGTGYFKMKLFESKRFKFDIYLIRFPKGSHIARHSDPAPEGYEHHRLNVKLKRADEGGEFIREYKTWDFRYAEKRIEKFRPDIQEHYVTKITKGTRYILSIGWLKEKDGSD